MKKLIAALTIALSIGTASAHPMYDMGYRHGKSDAYHRVATTVVVAGIAIIAGVAIYEWGYQSRWGMNDKGVVYRF